MASGHFPALLRNEARILRREASVIVLLVGMPLVLISLMRSTIRGALVIDGYPDASGAELLVPGQALMFAFFIAGSVAFAFFREHGWHTWDRLRASPASTFEIIAAKIALWIVIGCIQMGVLFTLGVLLFDLDVPASAIPGAAVIVLLISTFIALYGVALVALLPTMPFVNAISNLGAITFGALGGGLVPLNQLPGWAQAIAPASPTYWAMRGFRSLLLEDGGWGDLVLPIVVLVTFCLGAIAIAVLRFRVDEEKTSWA